MVSDKIFVQSELIQIKTRTKTIIIVSVVALVIITPRIIMNHYAEKEAVEQTEQ